jgi:hypothetical protein
MIEKRTYRRVLKGSFITVADDDDELLLLLLLLGSGSTTSRCPDARSSTSVSIGFTNGREGVCAWRRGGCEERGGFEL